MSAAAAGWSVRSAAASGCVDLVLPLAHIAHALVALTMAPGGADLFRVASAPAVRFAA
jgi:two-component system, chemotaxis family, protein-glutamate methylesterase/glutaminase